MNLSNLFSNNLTELNENSTVIVVGPLIENKEKAEINENCRICNQISHGYHFGIIACRYSKFF